MEDRSHWDDILKSAERKGLLTKNSLSRKKKSFKNKGEIKTFPDKQKLREFNTTKPAIQETLKGVL